MIVYEGRVPIKSWCNNPAGGALEQAKNLSSLPFTFKQVCLMPDTHQGYGMPIGGVIATKGVVIPNAVGVDIGCGMCAVKTSLKKINTETIKKIFGGSKENKDSIRTKIPVGFKHHSKKQDESLMPNLILSKDKYSVFEGNLKEHLYRSIKIEYPIVSQEYNSALKQLGTLGGGNHFIEIQKDSKGYIWIMIHSGSRNLGYKVAKHYNKLAQDLCQKWYSNIPKIKGENGLAFLPVDTEEGQLYLNEMNYCLQFAYANRKLMMERIKESFLEVVDCEFEEMINMHHNYANIENHFGHNVWVHRKGATSAKEGQIGIIPGSQGTASYIVKGKGNPESFMSCSHGAGRKMGRKQAQRELSLENETQKLNDKGIIHSIRNVKDLDEASGAYKDIDVVMEEQKDLVDIYVKLEPLAVIKG